MPSFNIKTAAVTAGLITALASPLALTHFDDKEIPQSYRQSWFALTAANFGPMAEMMKGNIPWNDAMFQAWANDFATLATLNIMRGFPPGSETGKTRAKPSIWENMDDFESKMNDMKEAAQALQQAAATGDREAIGKTFETAGGSCKSCHDDYKSKDYLN